jgi:hypothetical protein
METRLEARIMSTVVGIIGVEPDRIFLAGGDRSLLIFLDDVLPEFAALPVHVLAALVPFLVIY